METTLWEPLDLTPIHFICIRPCRGLYIQCQQWKNGQKFLNIYKHIYKSMSSAPIRKYLPAILVPQDAYKFVAAMDTLICTLPAKEPTHPENDESPLNLPTQIVMPAKHYYFKLLAWHQKDGEWHFDIRTVPTSEEHEESRLFFPFSALPWLRKQIVTILAEHDGSQWIKEMPKIREWASGPNENVVPQQQTDEIINFSLAVAPNRKLSVEFDQHTKDEKIIKTIRIITSITYESNRYYESLPRILIPQVAYKFLSVLDRLIGQLPAEERMVRRRIVNVEHYNFKLVWHQDDGKWHIHIRSVQTVQEHKPKQVKIPIWALPRSVQTVEEHKPKQVKIPIWALPWLRQQMAKILVKHDGSEQIGEMPAIPIWVTRDAPKIEPQEKQPGVKQEQVTDKKADDAVDEDSPCCSKKGMEEMHAAFEKIGQFQNEPR